MLNPDLSLIDKISAGSESTEVDKNINYNAHISLAQVQVNIKVRVRHFCSKPTKKSLFKTHVVRLRYLENAYVIYRNLRNLRR